MKEPCKNFNCENWRMGLPCNCLINKTFSDSSLRCSEFKDDWPGEVHPAVSVENAGSVRPGIGAGKGEQDGEAFDGIAFACNEIANTLQYWLDFNEKSHDGNVNDDTNVIPSHWPSRGVLISWIGVLKKAGRVL